MPRGTLKRLVDALTNNTSSSVHTSGNPSCGKNEPDFGEKLSIDQFQPCKIVRHGFPNKPSALAYDPLQKLLAIGCYNGSIRIIGQPGVDCFVTHETEAPIIQLLFLANQGALVSVCADDAIHLWNLRQTKPAILHSLLFKRERITCCHIPHQSKWMYIGTDRGNTHLCNVETFTLSGYSINWNKAIVLSQKSHPGHVVSICENPVDENKLLISYNSGFLVLWDLKNRIPDHRYNYSRSIRHTCWHFEGKQFLCCHDDGTLTIWNYRNSSKPQQEQRPHALSKEDTCFPMVKADWLSCRNSDPFIIFSGATSRSNLAKPSVTIMKGRSISILEVDFPVIDFKALVGTPWPTDFQDPTALVVLTENELVVIDLESPDYPAIEMDHAMDIHDSPVTCLKYVPDADTDLIPGLYQVAATKPRREENTKKEWPITGGEWSMDDCDGIPEIFVTGHADGSVRFWDASAVFLKALYKLRTKKIFKREENSETEEDDPFQITHIALCPESRTLVVANISSAVVAYKLETQETQSEITCLNVSPEKECHRSAENLVESNNVHTLSTNCKDGAGKEEHVQSNESDSNKAETNNHDAPSKSENDGPVHHATQPTPSLKVKNGSIKQSAGFQAYLTCLVFENDVDSTCNITYLSLNTSFQLFALGTTSHICIVDMLQKTCLFNMTADALLISMDKRIPPRSPNRLKTGLSEASQSSFSFDQPSLKSPTDEGQDTSARTSDAKTKWGAVAMKTRLGRKSVGGYFAKPRSPLNFRRSSMLPKSPTNSAPKPLRPHFSQSKLENTSAISTPGILTSPEEVCDSNTLEEASMQSSPRRPWMKLYSGEKWIIEEREFNEETSEAEPSNNNQSHFSQSSYHGSSHKSVSREQSTSSTGSSCAQSVQRIKKPQHRMFKKTQSCSFEKSMDSTTSAEDSVFSRGSSFSDAERSNPREIVTFLNFAHTYTKKNDYVALPCLWIGTSGGYIFNVMISLPSSCEQRSTQLVVASPSGTVLQMKSSVVYCTFLNSAGQHVSAGAGNWREHCNAGHVGGTCDTPGSDRTNQTTVDKQFMVVSSERDAKVFTLPSQVCMHSVSFHADVGPVVQATVDTVHRGTFLACFTANGYILVYGLPCLNLLMEAAYLPANDVRISNTFCFGLSAQAVYLASHSEIQRMTYSVDTYESMQEVIGHLFIPCESPERPNPGFFKGLFGGGHAALDREELFGEDQSGKPSRGVAQHVPGTGGSSLEGLRSTSSGLASDMQRLRMQAQERGEKLSDLEDKTRQMNESAMKFSSGAHSLMLKYKSKKWYQM